MSVGGTSSYVYGASCPPLRDETVGGALRSAARRWPAREALVVPYQAVRWTKVPRYVRFVDRYPTTVTGKVRKHVMREQMAAEVGPP